jgi:two-component system chemotaxis sensor kinase CheA
VGEERFVLPNSDVEKIMPLPARALHRINSRERVVETPDGVLPLIELGERLGRTARTQGAMNGKVPGAAQGSTLLITRTGNQRHALLIDEVMGQQRIVHKNLGVEARKIPGVSGATILGDGTVALILELSVLVNRGPSGGVAA